MIYILSIFINVLSIFINILFIVFIAILPMHPLLSAISIPICLITIFIIATVFPKPKLYLLPLHKLFLPFILLIIKMPINFPLHILLLLPTITIPNCLSIM